MSTRPKTANGHLRRAGNGSAVTPKSICVTGGAGFLGSHLCARLVDVHPDGTATRVSFGVLNLAHRDGDADPQPMPHGRMIPVTLVLDACGYHLRPGHRLRLARGARLGGARSGLIHS